MSPPAARYDGRVLRNAVVLVGSALVLGVLALGTWRVSTKEESRARPHAEMFEDLMNLKGLVGLCATAERLPMKDGTLDPYHFVKTGRLVPEQFPVFRSHRRDVAPTEEEIRRGDYTSFPWERYRGDRTDCRPPVFPLLWEAQPIRGLTLVGFSDGSACALEAKELKRWGLAR